MNIKTFEDKLLQIAESEYNSTDPSHDILHVRRVLENARSIALKEKADLEVIIPAALFHDIIDYPKNDNRSKKAVFKSADKAEDILKKMQDYPVHKIASVKGCIQTTSKYGKKPETIEEKIVSDADHLEMTGAAIIMRVFASTGIMQRPFYNPEDPFCSHRSPEDLKYALDLLYSRSLKIKNDLFCESARAAAEQRHDFLLHFLKQLKLEITGI